MAGSKKKINKYWLWGGGAAVLLIMLMMSRRSGGSATPVPADLPNPATNPPYDGSYGGGSSYTPPPAQTSSTDYSAQMAQSLSQLSVQLSDMIAKQSAMKQANPPKPAPTPDTKTAPTTISGLQTAFVQYSAQNPGKNMQNDAYLSGLHEQANGIRLNQIAQLQANFQAYQKTHPGATMKNTPYLSSLHDQADKLRSQLKTGG